ncbi:MAG: DUF5675 family protein [Rhodospirillaceae bacterium]|nr:DUF5675 family protein [Rhodospirillaceae bacterium]
MRRAVLLRDRSDDHGTRGLLAADGLSALHVMEPPWRDNRRCVSCIPAGVYAVLPHRSPRFRDCLLVTGVPGRSHILIHRGNLGGDRENGYHTHTMGCLLPGEHRGRIKVRGRVQAAVLASAPAFRRVMAWAAGRPFALEIVDHA